MLVAMSHPMAAAVREDPLAAEQPAPEGATAADRLAAHLGRAV
jgi:hypothetical protein